MNKDIIKKKSKDSFKILKHTATNFWSNDPVSMAGTTAYFAIFSIAPILIIIISVFGFFTDDEVISSKLFSELDGLIGSDSTKLLRAAIENYEIADNGLLGVIIGGVIFLVSATTLFGIMQNSINYIWRVKVKSKLKQNILKLLRDRLFSFGMILSLGFVVLVSLIVDASLEIIREFISSKLHADFDYLVNAANLILSVLIISAIFALIFRYLPDVKVKWSAAWFGAAFAAVMFFIGKYIIGFIIGQSQLGAVYGAASSFVIILLWIYFVSIIFYFGVEITKQFSKYYKHNNVPLNFAIPFEISTTAEGEKIKKEKETDKNK